MLGGVGNQSSELATLLVIDNPIDGFLTSIELVDNSETEILSFAFHMTFSREKRNKLRIAAFIFKSDGQRG